MNFLLYTRLLKELNPLHAILYSYILHLDSVNGCYIKDSTLAETLGVGERHVQGMLVELDKNNWISRSIRRMRNGRKTRKIYPKRFLHLTRDIPKHTSESNNNNYKYVEQNTEVGIENKEESVCKSSSKITKYSSDYNNNIKDIINNRSSSDTNSFREEVGSESVVDIYCADPNHDCIEVPKDEYKDATPCPVCSFPMETEETFRYKYNFSPKSAFTKSNDQFSCKIGLYTIEDKNIMWIRKNEFGNI